MAQKQDTSLHINLLEIEGYPFRWLREDRRVSRQKFEVNFKVSSKRNAIQIPYCPLATRESESSCQYRLRAPSDLVLGMKVNADKISIDLLQLILEKKTNASSTCAECQWVRFNVNLM